MSPFAKASLFGGVALLIGSATWLWGERGVAILLDYSFVGCL